MITNLDEGYRLYGAGILMQFAANMVSESAGVKAGIDIEYIHRMRVASRRLRVALPLFADCFPKKEHKCWENEIKQIMRSLGHARDLDVQIAFLRAYLNILPQTAFSVGVPRFLPEKLLISMQKAVETIATLPPGKQPQTPIAIPWFFTRLKRFFSGKHRRQQTTPAKPEVLPSKEAATEELRSGIECLTLRLMQERTALQPEVIKAVEQFEKSKTLSSLQDACMEIIIRGKLQKIETKTPASYQTAYCHISLCREKMMLYAKALADPERITAHHEMRIAAKKLRYTMETYRDLYDDGLVPSIKMVKELQDYLGDMHDCDVWMEFLPRFLMDEAEKSVAYFGNTGFMAMVRPGIAAFEEDRKAKRAALHTDANVFWKKNEGVLDQLERNLVKPFENLRMRTLSIPNSVSSITFFANVHANLPALEVIIANAKDRGCTTFLHAGTSKECPVDMEEKHYACHRKTWKKLSANARAALLAMPAEIRFVWGCLRIVAMHQPVELENTCPETPDDGLKRLCTEVDADVIICGRARWSFAKKIQGVWSANTGRSGGGDLHASYLLTTRDPFTLYHIHVPYDLEETLKSLEKQKEIPALFVVGLSSDETASAHSREQPKAVMPNTVSTTTAQSET
ncbi:MAG: CHAD domain-containing protein [Methanocalculaceae archaeon]|jgi:CHAD domain-containing protein|nr:CHAD domain-containing protein [Methanocalculaceae archaeon]